MRVLAMDTTTARESVALLDGTRLLGEVRLDSGDVHSRRLLPAAVFLLESLGLDLQALGGFGVAVGPGSFTGLRVGISTIQGLALGSGRPCAGVSALDALGRQAAGAGRPVLALIDALRGEVYAAAFEQDGRPTGEAERCGLEAALARAPRGALLAGDGVTRHRARIAELREDLAFGAEAPFLAESVARLAAERLAQGAGVGPGALRPLYLREAYVQPLKG